MNELLKKYGEIIRYVIVGGLTTIVSLLSYYICVLTFLNPDEPVQLQIANVISWICAVAFAFTTNRKIVFKSSDGNKFQQFVRFVGARLTTLIIDMASMALMVSIIHLNDKIAKIIVQFIVFALNYIFSKFFVFRKNN